MSRRPAAFRQSDLQRALRAAKAAGIEISRVEIDPLTGKIVIIAACDGNATKSGTALDAWLAKHAGSS
jgi:hypothetical protein